MVILADKRKEMRLFGPKILLNIFFLFWLFYLVYHIFHGRYNLQNYLINKFELELFQDFHYNLKQKSTALDMDLKALYYQKNDFLDEISKKDSEPEDGEIIIKLD